MMMDDEQPGQAMFTASAAAAATPMGSTRPSSAQFSRRVALLGLFSTVTAVLRGLRKTKFRMLLTASVLVAIAAVLIALRDPSEYGPDNGRLLPFNPYEMLEFGDRDPSTITKQEVKKQYRRLAAKMHLDRLPRDLPEEQKELARKRFVWLQESQRILSDDKKKLNYDDYGHPDGEEADIQLEDAFPEWVVSPGKKFLAFFGVLTAGVIALPFGWIFLAPGLEEPPVVVRDYVAGEIVRAEELLAQDGQKLAEAQQSLDAAQQLWDGLLAKFPAYKDSIWSPVIDWRITCRRCQILLVQGASSDSSKQQQVQQAVIKLFGDLRAKYAKSASITRGELTPMIKPQALDVQHTLEDLKYSSQVQKNIFKSFKDVVKIKGQ